MIRPYEPHDWPGVWEILEPVFREGDTYAYSRGISEKEARQTWTGSPREVFVAVDRSSGEIVGTYYLEPNQEGPGDHVCNCGYVVSEKARGMGIASDMCKHSQKVAAARGFHAMQFNLVVSTNAGAIRLWRKLGFEIVGTLPEAFRHPRKGFVDAYVMYKLLA